LEVITIILQIAIIIILLVGGWMIKNYLPSYFSEKGKNLATKEDIEEITRKVESVKSEIHQISAIEQAKRELKYEACLDALSVIDAFFSHYFTELKPTPQEANTARARECHSKLILSCENTEIIEKFAEIMFGPADPNTGQKPKTDLLNEFRNLVRKELGFGDEIILDRDRAWFGSVTGDPNNPR
jgi:hypothetical protein